jgi:hypothetical protein
MNYWIDVYYRDKTLAYATIDIQSQNKYKSDKWNMNTNEKLYEVMVGKRKYADVRPNDHLAICKRTQNFLIDIDCPLLPKVICDDYEKLKLKFEYDDAELVQKKDTEKISKRALWANDKLGNAIRAIKELHPKFGLRKLSADLGISVDYISAALKKEAVEVKAE